MEKSLNFVKLFDKTAIFLATGGFQVVIISSPEQKAHG